MKEIKDGEKKRAEGDPQRHEKQQHRRQEKTATENAQAEMPVEQFPKAKGTSQMDQQGQKKGRVKEEGDRHRGREIERDVVKIERYREMS